MLRRNLALWRSSAVGSQRDQKRTPQQGVAGGLLLPRDLPWDFPASAGSRSLQWRFVPGPAV